MVCFGDPAYAREYILNMPPADKIAGFYMGPDGYVWGRDFLERHPDPGPRPLVMEKQWYSFMLWGRLAYDPSLPDSRFEKILVARQPMEQTTPLQIAEALDGAVAETFASLDTLREAAKEDSELRKTVNDCEALAWLGRYYASKIRGACALALFDANGDKSEHDAALRHLGDALAHWKQYAAIRDAHYVPALYNRVGHVNVTALTETVAADLDIARNWKPGTLKDDGKRAGSERGFRQ